MAGPSPTASPAQGKDRNVDILAVEVAVPICMAALAITCTLAAVLLVARRRRRWRRGTAHSEGYQPIKDTDQPEPCDQNEKDKELEDSALLKVEPGSLPTAYGNPNYESLNFNQIHKLEEQLPPAFGNPNYQSLNFISPTTKMPNRSKHTTAQFCEPGPDENALYMQFGSIDIHLFSKDTVKLVGHLGSGQFGTVEKGVWESPFGRKDVAVKTLNPKAPGNDRIRFLQEAAIMGQFSHPNVVEMYGIITDGKPMMIILELLPKGDLRNYLQSIKPGHPGPSHSSNVSELPHTLLSFCRQIASGMCYLANKGFVHRDLAARNILVSEDDQCKIADFGMSRDLDDGYYMSTHGGKIPVKWTAPEALYYKKYSTASDVWSFGCVLFEIWSLGHKPFEQCTNDMAVKLIDENYRLPPPPGCPRAIYDLMIQCWHPSKSDRPPFSSIHQTLSLSDTNLLRWSSEDMGTHPQAAVLGAPLECGEKLYVDLQKKYANYIL